MRALAARRSRSLMASPSPVVRDRHDGNGRRRPPRRARAGRRTGWRRPPRGRPTALRLIMAPACFGTAGPNASSASPVAHLARLEPQPGRGRVVPRQHARRGGLARLALGQRRPAGRATRAMLVAREPPSRRTTGSSPVTSTTVDSSPIGAGPPSRMIATLAPRSASTCAAVVGLTWPERLALGAAIGRSAARSSAWATGCAGTRSAMVSRPAVARSATGQPACLAITRVRAPGQNAAASSPAGVGEAPEPGGGIRYRARARSAD